MFGNSSFSFFLGACHLGNSLAKVQRGLTKLALAQCGLTGKGVAQIGQTLSVNKFMSSSLVHLDLSSNAIKDEMAVRYQYSVYNIICLNFEFIAKTKF